MKKLLLILICLFVSFEVKSESDDLNGKNLLCTYKKEYINFGEKGFEFLSNSKVNFYHIITMKTHEKYGNLSVHKYEYETNLKFIFIQGMFKHTIDRKTLEIFLGVGIEPNTQCKIFEGNLKDYFIKKKEEIEKEVRPKNKI